MKKNINTIKIHDGAFKFMIELDPQGFLDRFDIPHKFKKFLPTENVLKISSHHRMDCLILTQEDVILNIEFQSTYPSKEKQELLREYATFTAEKYDKEVITYIISILPITTEEHWNELRCNIYHKVFEKSCNQLNGKEILNNIKNKIDNNEILENKDKQDLILAAYSTDNIKKSPELLKISMKLAHRMKTNNDEKLEKETGRMKYILMILCERIVKDENCKEIMRLGRMENTILDRMIQEEIQEGIREGIREGIEERIEERIEEVAKNMKEKNYTTKTIKELTGLTTKQIKQL